MTPDRTGDRTRGHYRIDRRFRGVGRLRLTAGTSSRREFERRNDLLTRLYEEGKLDVLEALRDKRVALAEVVAAARHGTAATMSAVVLTRPLWPLIDATLPRMGKSAETRASYLQRLDRLRGTAILPTTARVRDLVRVDWAAARPLYRSASDWNQLVAAVSRFLTLTLGHEQHPVRLDVMSRLQKEAAREREPDTDAAGFWRVHARLPEWAQRAVVTIAALGLRPGEYCDATADGLRLLTRELVVTGKSGERTVPVPEVFWATVAAAVPAPYARARRPLERVSSSPRYQRLAKAWKVAARAEGVTMGLHGLRHLFAQLAADAGQGDATIGDALGHATGSAHITRKYTRRTGRRTASDAAAALLKRGA